MKELYSLAQPSVDWEEFKKENKIYSERYNEWERNRENHPEWKDKTIIECIGPRPYEFYYLPKEVLKEVFDSYVYAYKIDDNQNLLYIIEILKNYCKKPIVDTWVKESDGQGHRGYDYPDNLKKEIIKIIKEYDDSDIMKESDDIINKFFEFLDMAGEFFSWNKDLNSFSMSIYLGASPNSNKQAVIDNWKIYRKQNIVIDDGKYNEE
jgi:hypothetical protein